ncbi:MAG: glycosyltransferase family 2 protein [bacterium]
MDLSIITVTWNSAKYIKNQIKSTREACGHIQYQQIVVDNNSSDETVSIIRSLEGVELAVNRKNQGFAKANNQGFTKAKGEFILFLNPDMRMKRSGMLEKMLNYMHDDPQIGVMSCKLVDQAGIANANEGPRRFPKIWEQLLLILKIPHIFPWILDRYHYKDFDFNKVQFVDSVRGAFMLVRRSVIEKLGKPFDERFFIWFEEVDLCRQARRMGYKIIYHPSFNCVDLVGRSFKQTSAVANQKKFTKSMLMYFQKWEPWWKWGIIFLFRPVGIGLTWLAIKFKFKKL